MIFKQFLISITIVFVAFKCYAHPYQDNNKKVKETIRDFNETLFVKMDVLRAIKAHHYLDLVDASDKRLGLESEIINIPYKLSKTDKVRYFAMQFFWEGVDGSLLSLNWWLGTNKVQNDTTLASINNEIRKSDALEKLSKTELIKFRRANKGELKSLDENSIRYYEKYALQLNSAISKRVDKMLLSENLEFIDKHTTIAKKTFEGKEYFEVENILFRYTVALKNGVPKIMNFEMNL